LIVKRVRERLYTNYKGFKYYKSPGTLYNIIYLTVILYFSNTENKL